MSVNSSPLERGLPGSHRVDHQRMAWMTTGALLIPECVSVMCAAPGDELRELVSQQYVLSRPVHGRGRWAAHSTIAVI